MKRECVWAYAAGLVDGEGWVGITKRKIYGRRRNVFYEPNISVMMTNEGAIDWLAHNCGGKKCSTVVRRGNHKSVYRWMIYGSKEATAFLEKIKCFSVVKKEQICIVLALCRSIEEHRWQHVKGGLPEYLLAYRESLCQESRRLNKKGKF